MSNNLDMILHLGEILEIKTIEEIGKSPNNSFLALHVFDKPNGTPGQTVWVRGEQQEIDFQLRLNPGDDRATALGKWMWALGDIGTLYLTVDGQDKSQATAFRWPRIIIASKDAQNLNRVLAVERREGFIQLAGLMKGDYDHDLIWLLTHGLAHHVWCCQPDSSLLGYHVAETPKGPYFMPIYDPAGGFKTSIDNQEIWIPDWYIR